MYDKWSLDVLYSGFDDTKFQSEFQKIDEYIEKFNALAASLGTKDDKTTIKEALQLREEYSSIINRLFTYCSLRQSVDTADTDSVSYIGRLMQKDNATTKPETIINKYLSKISNLDEVIEKDAFLQEYSYYLHELQKCAKYLLNEDVEAAIAGMDISGGSAWSDLQGFLTSSVKVDYDGGETTLSAIRNLAYDPDATIRKAAYEAELAAYDKIKDAIAYSLNSIKMQDITVC